MMTEVNDLAQQTLNTPRETTHQRIADALEDIVDKIVDTSSASNIDYDNTQSGLSANKAQGALDELANEKVDKVEGKGLSTNDYTDTEKQKLAGIEAEANKTVVDSAINDYSTNPLQNRVVNAFLNEKTDVNNFDALTQEIELFKKYDLTNDVEISVFANDTYKRDKYDRVYETHIPNLDGEYSVSLGDKTFTETCTFTIANQGTSITETFHTNSKYILGAKLLKAENDEVGDAHVIADVVTLLISKDAPYTTTFDPYLKHPPVTGVLTLKVSVKPDEKYVNKENTGGPSEYAYWGSYNGSDLLINNPILTYSETTFGQPKVSGNPITIGASESNLVECVAEIECVQEGSGDPSPENIRPIIGQTEVVIDDCGKNLFDSELSQGGIYFDTGNNYSSDIYVRTDFIPLKKGTYTISQNIQNAIRFYDKNKIYNRSKGIETFRTANTITLEDDSYIKIVFRASDSSNITPSSVSNIQLEVGDTATTYEPYNGKTYTIDLGGTRYGGTLDVVSGVLTLTYGYIASYNGETLPSTWISDRDVYAEGTTPTTGAEVVYELAEPYTIQLTPQQIRLLKGINNISCNTGDLSIKYYPDNVLGQLKGDIESEYDDRVETLETQVQELQPSLIFMSRERRDITSDLSRLSTAVAEQNLEKYGYKIGDYFTGASGYTYILADYNTFKGTSTPYCITSNHLGIVVDTHATSQWHSGDASNVGYNGSVLNTFLKGTVLDNIKTDFIALFGGSTGLEHLIAHSKLFTTALANWGWQANQYISALSEVQTIGSTVWSANGYQTGEAAKKLELFDKYKWTEIFEGRYPWLRDLYASSYACLLDNYGLANNHGVSISYYAVGLINFY